MRLFTAILPQKSVVEALAVHAERLKGAAQKGKFSVPGNYHLTLSFIGETDRVQAAMEALDQLRFEPFTLRIDGLERFQKRDGDVVFANVLRSYELLELQKQGARLLEAAGFFAQQEQYTPHITLARQARLDWPQECPPPMEMRVSSIDLMRSWRVDGRLTYSRIHERKLDGGAAGGNAGE